MIRMPRTAKPLRTSRETILWPGAVELKLLVVEGVSGEVMDVILVSYTI